MTVLNPDAAEFYPKDFFLTAKFAAAAKPAAAAPGNRRGKRGIRSRKCRIATYFHGSKHRKRCGGGTGRGTSGLLPPKPCLILSTHEARSISEQKQNCIISCKRTEEKKKRAARKKRRGRRADQRAAKKRKKGARARARIGELTVGTYNVRTLAFKGANGIGHSEIVLKPCESLGCDIVGLQETRRDGQSVFSAAGFTVFCSGDTLSLIHI